MARRAVLQDQESGEGGAVARTRKAVPEPEREPLKLEGLVHERVRLGILCALAVNPSLSFNELKALLDTTAGNLSVHARKLEEAGYVACSKSFRGRLPRTDYALTRAGKRALQDYMGHMEALVEAMKAR